MCLLDFISISLTQYLLSDTFVLISCGCTQSTPGGSVSWRKELSLLTLLTLLGCSQSRDANEVGERLRWTMGGVDLYEEVEVAPETPYEVPAIGLLEGKVDFHVSKLCIKNETGQPREIVDVRKGCGCTEVDFSKGEILPGGECELTIRVSTSGLASLDGRVISFKPIFSDGKALSFTQHLYCFPRLLEDSGSKLHTAKMLDPEVSSPDGSIGFQKKLLLLYEGTQPETLPALRVKVLPESLSAELKSAGEPEEFPNRGGFPLLAIPYLLRVDGTGIGANANGLAYSLTVSSDHDEDMKITCFGKVTVVESLTVAPRYVLMRSTTPQQVTISRADGSDFCIKTVLSGDALLDVSQLTAGFRPKHRLQISLKGAPTENSVTKKIVKVITTEDETVSFDVVYVEA